MEDIMKHPSRLSARCVGALLLALTLSGSAAAQNERFDGTTIRVATWGGSWRDRIQELIGQEFEKRGGHIEYVIGNPLDNFNKLIASRGQRPPFDVVEFQADTWRPLVETGMLEQLPRTEIPNASEAVPGQD